MEKKKMFLIIGGMVGALVICLTVTTIIVSHIVSQKNASKAKRITGVYRSKKEKEDAISPSSEERKLRIYRKLELKKNGEFGCSEEISEYVKYFIGQKKLGDWQVAKDSFIAGSWRVKGNTIILRKKDGSVFLKAKIEKRLAKGFFPGPKREHWFIVEDDGTAWQGPALYEGLEL